jgi:hypothetical protein
MHSTDKNVMPPFVVRMGQNRIKPRTVYASAKATAFLTRICTVLANPISGPCYLSHVLLISSMLHLCRQLFRCYQLFRCCTVIYCTMNSRLCCFLLFSRLVDLLVLPEKCVFQLLCRPREDSAPRGPWGHSGHAQQACAHGCTGAAQDWHD